MAKPSVKISKFDGGLNTKANPTNVPENQSPDLQNVEFDDFGAVGTRAGYTVLNTAAIASSVIDGLHSYIKRDDTKNLVAASNGDVFFLSGTTFVTVPSAQSVFTSGVDMMFETANDLLILSNGGTKPYKFNGTEFTQAGVSATTQVLTAQTNSDGTLTGGFEYKYAGVNSNSVEGLVGSASTIFTAASEDISVENIPTAPLSHGINEWFVYRNTAAASGVFFRVTSVTNGTTSFVDNNSDSTIVTSPKSLENSPPFFTTMKWFKDRLFAAAGDSDDPDRLYYSEVGFPEEFTSTNFLSIDEGDGGKIEEINVLTDGIIIGKSDRSGSGSMYLLYMPTTTPSDWVVLKLDSQYGHESRKVMTRFSNLLAFLNRDGFFALFGKDIALTTSETKEGSLSTDSRSFDIEPEISDILTSRLKNSAAVTFDNRVWLAVSKTSSATENNRVYQLDYQRASGGPFKGAWSRFTNMSFNDFAIHEGDLYGGSSLADGFVYKMNTGFNDNGSAINSFFTTAPIFGQKAHKNNIKIFRYVWLLVEATGDFFMDVKWIIDLKDSEGNLTSIDLDPGSGLWNTIVWGADDWGGAFNQKRIRIDFSNAIGRSIQLKFQTNTADQNFKVHEMEIFYNLKGKRL